MKKHMLIAVSVLLLALNIPLLTFCTAEETGGAVESALCEDGENSINYRVGIAAYSAVTDAETADILLAAKDIKRWLTVVEEAALTVALDGKKWPGLKLVEGRSRRVITDTDAAAKAAVSVLPALLRRPAL